MNLMLIFGIATLGFALLTISLDAVNPYTDGKLKKAAESSGNATTICLLLFIGSLLF